MNIQLIVMISPDKYAFYYNNIIEKEKYPEPLFFEHFNKLSKQYLYVNTKEILAEYIDSKKDLYFYDDTHWSPFASEILAKEMTRTIFNKENMMY